MKKVAIVTRQMVAGGIEKALISMLENMLKEEYDITLFLMARGGDFETLIPDWIKVKCIYGDEESTKEKVLNSIKKGNYVRVIKIIYYTILYKLSKSVYKQEKYLAKIMPNEDEVYDIAISYHVPASFPVIYNIEHLKSKKRVGWIHSDVEQYQQYLSMYINHYFKFDKIFCVSKYAKDKFDTIYPLLSEKTEVFYNIIDKDKIYTLANMGETYDDEYSGIRILTVGRMTSEKGYDIIPEVLFNLINNGYDVRWYCIGDGELKKSIKHEVKKRGIEEKLIFLGTITNPYTYFKDCDIYVQPSRHEGYCITLAEAKLLNKPIVSTNFIGALEQIKNEQTGLVVNFDEKEIYKGISRLIDEHELSRKLVYNLTNEEYANKNEIKKLYDVI